LKDAILSRYFELAHSSAIVWRDPVGATRFGSTRLAQASMTQPYARPSINQASAMMKIDDKDNKHLWIFAYGSLMWRPGFSYLERVPARLVGLHRALCVFSFVHRGTPERPGLVLGLDRGGMCRGIAYRVAAASRADTLQYLRSREQVTSVYVETVRQIQLEDHAARRVRAVCYIVDRSHVQYAGRLTLAKSLHHVRQGHGRSGANRDYVLETVRALEALGYRESDLHLLAERLKSQGSGIGHQAPGISHQASGKQQQRTGDQTSEMSVLDP
jgi:glutathione-specific gamma-glutamylcyclotransferase